MTFFFEIDLAAGNITETFSRRSGDFQIMKHNAALGTIANIQCGPHNFTSLTPLVYCIYYSTRVAGLIYCICTTSVFLLMFYDLSKCIDKVGCVFTKCICSKCKYIPEKIPYFKTTEICKLRKNG